MSHTREKNLSSGAPIKRGRGRPKGSKNKPKGPTHQVSASAPPAAVPRPRGRPRKVDALDAIVAQLDAAMGARDAADAMIQRLHADLQTLLAHVSDRIRAPSALRGTAAARAPAAPRNDTELQDGILAADVDHAR